MKSIMQAVRERSSLNEIVRLQETVANNHRMDIYGAYRRWSANLQLNSVLEVLMEVVDRVDMLCNRADTEPVAAEFKEESVVVFDMVSKEDYLALLARVEALESKGCDCKQDGADVEPAVTDTETEPVADKDPETPVVEKKKPGPAPKKNTVPAKPSSKK